jgi:hypothetical protein
MSPQSAAPKSALRKIDGIIESLAAVDVDQTTPLEALSLLHA